MALRKLTTWLFVIAAAVGGYYFYQNEKEKQALADARMRAERAVEVLPAGTEEAWLTYIEKVVEATIKPEEGQIRVIAMGDKVMKGTTLVSRNTPYQVQCSPFLGISVIFGHGENSVTAPLSGVLALDRSPPLGVSKASKAAEKLSSTLCARVGVLMREILRVSR